MVGIEKKLGYLFFSLVTEALQIFFAIYKMLSPQFENFNGVPPEKTF